MDLGFGASNQAVGSAAAMALLRTVEAQEKALEGEIFRYDTVLDDSAALEQLRLRRLKELQSRQQQMRLYRELGHGTYQDLGSQNTADVAKEFFDIAKKSSRVVVHFYRPTTRHCDVFHRHLKVLAERHWETRFVSINVEACESSSSGSSSSGAAFLVDRLSIVVMPTLLIVKDRQSVHQLRGFDEVGNTPDFPTSALESILGKYGAVEVSDPMRGNGDNDDEDEDEESPREVRSIRATTQHAFRKGKGSSRRNYGDEEEDF
jgi:Phosducin